MIIILVFGANTLKYMQERFKSLTKTICGLYTTASRALQESYCWYTSFTRMIHDFLRPAVPHQYQSAPSFSSDVADRLLFWQRRNLASANNVCDNYQHALATFATSRLCSNQQHSWRHCFIPTDDVRDVAALLQLESFVRLQLIWRHVVSQTRVVI